MVIIRIFNNNVIEAKERGREMIVRGKGIAFGKKAGEKIFPAKEHKIYYLSDSKEYQYVKSLTDIIPGEYWDFTARIVDYAEAVLKKKLDANIYFSLLDHFYAAVKRAQGGMVINGFFSSEIKLYFKELYDLSSAIVDMAEKAFEIQFDESEVYFVATHLLDASLETASTISLERAADVIDCAVNNVKKYFSEMIDEESSSYTRFITHLKLFAGRVVSSNRHIDNSEKERYNNMLDSIKTEFPKQSECLANIIHDIQTEFKYGVSQNEQFYLMLHIVKITETS